MTPEKIYLTAKGAEKLASAPEGVETTRVKTYPSKTDIEYTDLSQVWHTAEEKPTSYKDKLLIVCKPMYEWQRTDNGLIYDSGCYYTDRQRWSIHDLFKLMPDENVVSWAYINDLIPTDK